MDFVDQDEAAQIMYSSGFIDGLGELNLKARGALSKQEYKRNYKTGLADWLAVPVEDRQRLIGAVTVAKARAGEKGYTSLSKMQWRFGCSTGKKTENGWPHTIGDVIIIPMSALERRTDKELVKLLVHEAVHVAQRKDPEGAEKFITEQLGFSLATDATKKYVRTLGEIRQNPDVNNKLYEKDGVICLPVFYGNVTSLADVKYKPFEQFNDMKWVNNPEHPYEIMAELISNKIM
ncbi:hypothetical protein TetV_486 [Tetraselmis virus 1]|uniref:Uncharacterized protein n=1 Tax=Tetraselmis virus 1 TaxID=2060617 RepID=A0A2P0VNT6_9VIRU|nr:hypothetical protein QJ968_gp568 [Tetraselmis virus 1]AUF82568.1 hypothetical protein TetV_486 [Tetraselmis virus 1]